MRLYVSVSVPLQITVGVLIAIFAVRQIIGYHWLYWKMRLLHTTLQVFPLSVPPQITWGAFFIMLLVRRILSNC